VGLTIRATADGDEVYSIRAALEGEFQGTQEGLSLETFCQVNAPAILFPYLREVITNVSARSGHPAILFPTVNFVELARERGQVEHPST